MGTPVYAVDDKVHMSTSAVHFDLDVLAPTLGEFRLCQDPAAEPNTCVAKASMRFSKVAKIL